MPRASALILVPIWHLERERRPRHQVLYVRAMVLAFPHAALEVLEAHGAQDRRYSETCLPRKAAKAGPDIPAARSHLQKGANVDPRATPRPRDLCALDDAATRLALDPSAIPHQKG